MRNFERPRSLGYSHRNLDLRRPDGNRQLRKRSLTGSALRRWGMRSDCIAATKSALRCWGISSFLLRGRGVPVSPCSVDSTGERRPECHFSQPIISCPALSAGFWLKLSPIYHCSVHISSEPGSQYTSTYTSTSTQQTTSHPQSPDNGLRRPLGEVLELRLLRYGCPQYLFEVLADFLGPGQVDFCINDHTAVELTIILFLIRREFYIY